MKIQLFILLSFFFFQCPSISQVYIVPKGKQHSTTVDSLNWKNMPNALLQNYYSELNNDDIIEMVMVVDTLSNNRNLSVLTKHARDGYLLINNLINKWAINHSPFDYSIDGKIVKTKPMVEKLVSLRKEQIDTVFMKNSDRMVIIKTREEK